jgi:hypothetical protein
MKGTAHAQASAITGWRAARGLIAAAICVLLFEGVIAGLSRQCMPSFNLNILAGQVIIATLLGAPVIALVMTAAYIVAAAPSFHTVRSWLALVGVLVAIAAIILATPWHDTWALPFGGMLVGLCIRSTERFRRAWFPVAIILALFIAATLFASGHYGQNNCYP